MGQTFNLPAVGDTMVEATIAEWFVAIGDQVAVDQVICAIDTDKSTVEMSSPFAGTVTGLGGAIGDVVSVGAPLLVVGGDDDPSAMATSAAPILEPPQLPSPGNGNVRSPLVRRLANELGVDTNHILGSGAGGAITRRDVEAAAAATTPSHSNGSHRVKAMPKVRRAARERGVNLAQIAGSGARGVIVLTDLDAASPAPAERRVPLTATRRAIGDHLTASAQTIPQFTSMIDVDATSLLALRAQLTKRTGSAVPLDALIMALLIPVLHDHPMMNARLDAAANEIVVLDHYDIGVAVDTPDGLLVPVVRDAASRNAAELAAEILRLAEGARNRQLHPNELLGATTTVNNVGAVGIEAGTPILPLDTTSIIAPGRAKPVVQIRDGHTISVQMITISATFDHRVVDGGDAGRFLTQLRDHLEVPALGLL